MIQLEKCSEYGKNGVLTGPDKENQEVSMLALHCSSQPWSLSIPG